MTHPEWSAYVKTVIVKLDEWFWKIEDGSANKSMPDPIGTRFSEEEVNRIIDTIDRFIDSEIENHPSYWLAGGTDCKFDPIDKSSDFRRLEGASREAFVQDLYTVLKHISPGEDDYGWGYY